MNDRKLQLDTYSELLQKVTIRKPIDIDMAIEPFFKNLVFKKLPTQNNNDFYCDVRDDKYYFEYSCQYLGGHLMASHMVEVMFENMGVSRKKAEWYIKRMMNRHHNISRVKYFAFYVNC